jgi:hypothetical protein
MESSTEPPVDTFREGLAAFASAVRSVPDVEEPPKTTLGVLDRRQREDYWNRLVRYFLDPSEPHGFGTAVLDGVLALVAERSETADFARDPGGDAVFEYGSPNEVVVESEVQSARANRPDLFVYVDDGWSVCFELKVTAGEGRDQTRRYYEDFPPDGVSIPEGEDYYVYVSKSSRPDADAAAFLDVGWTAMVDVFDAVIAEARGSATERGTAQLRDFRDAVRAEVSMTHQKYTERQREKMALYLEHYDEIAAAERAFEAIHQRERDRWARRFCEEFAPAAWSDEWNCDPSKYGLIYRDGWRLDADGTPVDDVDEAAVRLEFQHFVRRKQTFTDGSLRFRVFTSRHGSAEHRRAVKELTNGGYYDELASIRERYGIEHVRGKKTHAEKHYSFDPQRGPVAFYETLATAFDEFVDLAPVLTEIHERALERAAESD